MYAVQYFIGISICVQRIQELEKALGRHGYIDQHRSSKFHKTSNDKAASFLQTQRAGTDIIARINKHISEQQVQTKKKGILAITDVILPSGQGGIGLRGNWG